METSAPTHLREDTIIGSPAIPAITNEPKSNLRRQLDDLLFGSVAGMVGKFVEYPFDTVKVRLQTQPLDRPYYSGPLNCVKVTLQQEGFKSLYRGLSSPLIGSMVENAALFVGYRQVQRLIRNYSATPQQIDEWESMNQEDLPALSMNQLVVAGAASGALASFVLTPVELVKCKLQVQIGTPSTASSTSAATAGQPIRYTGPFHVIAHTIRQHGFSGFYRGYLATLIRETGGGAFWFGMYEYTCDFFMRQHQRRTGETITKKDLSPGQLMLGGALGGMAYNFSFFPVDVIKSQMQTDEELLSAGKRARQSFMQTARSIYVGGGIPAFYRGCGITVARSAPSSAIIFLTYELLSRHFGA
ncbi:mitochondrial carrier domain-containing protein [Radiomyces spectabilis]|uniref:mitochondrial carrier domain-containing protein n=1 Tax=Radiomyces spectabilis TaxID=64574 RepID=UPI00221E814F|nr:mitochondrial carrier domain-containing protein [Radiomyces spectabilis]KAI8381556.1 mitochondrial carrier domain-containing protein [Radiomyces spectabilis]